MRAIWASAFLLRRLRAETGVAAIIFVLVAATAFGFAAAPRLLNRAADEGLQAILRRAEARDRNVQLSLLTNLAGSVAPGHLQRVGDELAEELPDGLRALFVGRSLVATSVRFAVDDAPRYANTFLSLRYQDGLTDAIRLVAGRMPESTGQPFPPAAFGFPGEGEPPQVVPRLEVALSERTADELGIELGDLLSVAAGNQDPLLSRIRLSLAQPVRATLAVVGIFSVTRPDADAWFSDTSLAVVSFASLNPDNPIALGTGLIAPSALADLAAAGLPFTFDARYFVDPARLDASGVEPLQADLERLRAKLVSTASPSAVQLPVLRTGLPELLDDFVAQRVASETVLSVAAIGPLTLAAGAVGMVGVLLVSRRRGALAVTRGRGASGLLVLGAQLWEATLLAGGAALLGLAAAVTLVPGRASPLSALMAGGVALATTAALLGATWPEARRPLGAIGVQARPSASPSPRRLVSETTVVLIAAGGIWLLRQRGLTIGGDPGAGFDPLLAATPALAGLAVGIVAMRLYPYPIRALGWLAARRRDLVPVLALRTVGRHPSTASLPLLVLMLTAAFGAFASVVSTTVDRAQVTASWENLGADYTVARRLGSGPLSAAVDAAGVPGVEAVAAAYRDDAAAFRGEPEQRATILLYAVAPRAYREVVAGSPIDPAWPQAMLETDALAGLGTPANPIPAILSRRLPLGSRPVQPGDRFEVEVGGQLITFIDVEERDSFPGLPAEDLFVVVPFEALQAAHAARSAAPLQPNLLLVRGPARIEEALSEAVTRQMPGLGVTSRHAAYAELRRQPLVAAVSIGFRAALLVAAAYLTLSVLAALTLSAARRTRDLAFLRTLGLSAWQSVGLTLVEHAPPVLLALVPGVALGVAVALLLAPSLGLGSFAGATGSIGITVDWTAVVLLAGGLLALVGLAIAIASWAARRTSAMDALRIGDD